MAKLSKKDWARCSKCGKELSPLEKTFAGIYLDPICANCVTVIYVERKYDHERTAMLKDKDQ